MADVHKLIVCEADRETIMLSFKFYNINRIVKHQFGLSNSYTYMESKEYKKALKKKFKKEEENSLLNSIPISLDHLQNLLMYLNNLDDFNCDHSHHHTIEFLNTNNLDVYDIIDWFEQNGGYCDCEVLNNIYDVYGKFVGWCLD